MTNNSLRYKRISQKYLSLVTKTRVASRILFLKQVAGITERAILPPGIEIRFCAIRLTNAVYSYFYDKERSKDFHGHQDEPCDEKKLAQMVKWISRIKPFSVHFNDGIKISPTDKYYYQNLINPIFCAVLFKISLPKKDLNKYFDPKLLYELHYGNATANMLMVLFERSE